MPAAPSQVYLIESECGRVKVGCSQRPESRLATFYTNSPRPLRLIAFWPGGYSDEREIHERFSSYRTHNEWFRLEGAFADFVDERRGLGVTEIPEWVSLHCPNVRERSKAKRAAAQKAIRSDPAWKAEQALNRAFQKRCSAEIAALGRSMTIPELSRLYDEHYGPGTAEAFGLVEPEAA